MKTLRLTAAQAMVRYLAAQQTAPGVPLLGGVWAIFGHGNVAALGEALYACREILPTYRGHNEQSMAHAAIAYAKASNRRRAMAVTTSIGPGATNLATAAAVAHVNRLPVLLIPGDVFANRAPDPVLQQIEAVDDGTVSANDCLRPVSRYFDRITRPEQLLRALPRAIRVLTDPAECGPVTLAFCQDVQAEAFDFPESFFAPRQWMVRRPHPDPRELTAAAAALRAAARPLIIAGGGVHYAEAAAPLRDFAARHHVPVAETQAGKSALAWDDPHNLGAIGVTGGSAANAVAESADVVLCVGTRMQDFTTGSWALFKHPNRRFILLNVAAYDAAKQQAMPLVSDAAVGLAQLSAELGDWRSAASFDALRERWLQAAAAALDPRRRTASGLPSDAQVLGVVNANLDDDAIMVCAAGGLPGELHKLWRAASPNGYHAEYGFSCMGYEIAGGLGVKLAQPERDVVVMVGDGSYLMMNSELATAVMLGRKLIVVLLDNRGFGCITRLQQATGGERFNNLLDDAWHETPSAIDFTAHARALGADAEKVSGLTELSAAMGRARAADNSYCIVIDTDPLATTDAGGAWWDIVVPEVSERSAVAAARAAYLDGRRAQRASD